MSSILFLTSNFPKPLDGGGKIRDYYMLRWLAQNHELAVAGFRDPELDAEDAFLDFIPRENCHLLDEPQQMRLVDFLDLRLLPRWCLSYFSSDLQALVDELLGSGRFDRVHISHSYMAYYLLDYVDRLPCVIDHHNVKSHFFANAARETRSWRKKVAHRAEHRRWLHYEREVIPRFREHLSCSPREQVLLREMTHAAVHLLPSGVDTGGFMPKVEPLTGNNLLFTGSLDYFPNEQAVDFFCAECLPALREAVPDVTLQVVGKNPTLKTEKLLEKTPNTWFSYNVRDIRPFYYQSSVFVVPLLTGAGTRLKIMEAMAVGLPVVSTSKGAEGLGLSSGEGIIITDDPAQMTAACIRLIGDTVYRNAMGQKAREVCRERFGWDRIFARADAEGIYR